MSQLPCQIPHPNATEGPEIKNTPWIKKRVLLILHIEAKGLRDDITNIEATTTFPWVTTVTNSQPLVALIILTGGRTNDPSAVLQCAVVLLLPNGCESASRCEGFAPLQFDI